MGLIAADMNVVSLLKRNPGVEDNDLKGVIRANMINPPNVSVTTETFDFAVGKQKARVIYITPYGRPKDFLVSVKRAVVGVDFVPQQGTDKITAYVLGQLSHNDPDYRIAKAQVDVALEQRRRFTVAISLNASTIQLKIDENKGWCVIC